MDIRRLSLWEGRNATFMSNGPFSTVIEDQGEITLEMTSRTPSGARMSPLCLPYFRGTGSGVLSDPNGDWWRMRQGLYQCGGAYFSFPHNDDEIVNTSNTSWLLRRYGTEDEFGGVWKYSEMKSREVGNHYHVGKVDLVLPDHNVLYTAISVTNLSPEPMPGNPAWTSMLSAPLIETKATIATNSRSFRVYPVGSRESGVNRFVPYTVFDDLKKAPLLKGGTADASVVPPATGTYDFILGSIGNEDVSWTTVINPSDQMCYLTYTHRPMGEDEFQFPVSTIGENWYGRMDAPWALFDGATPQVRSLSVGFSFGERGSSNFVLQPGETKVTYIGNAYFFLDNQRIATSGFYQNEIKPEGFLLKRTKSAFLVHADTAFTALRKISKRLFLRGFTPQNE